MQPQMPAPSSSPQQGLAGGEEQDGGTGGSGQMMMVEDCRDYLRTGRCKYGASCKYNHPSNVQSGGGMKAPINPGEPMFPLRPTEPICQYYMKHGTCKFGQACKFHHPPPLHHHHSQQQSLHALMVGGTASSSNGIGRPAGTFSGPTTMLMSLGGQHHAVVAADQSSISGSGTAPHSLLCNPIGTDPASGSMILQFLPQRPDEPDCIYFLKNGRCKYGATCRYHHPIAYQPNNSNGSNSRNQQRLVVDDPPRRLPPMHSQPVRMVSGGGAGGGGMNSSRGGSPPDSSSSYRGHSGQQFVSQMIPAYGTQSSSSSSLANDAQYLNLDTLSSSPLQPVPVVSMDGTTSYAYPIAASAAGAMNHGNEHNSSASSLASSYETAGSSYEHLQEHGDSASAALWNRARRNGSGGSLNAYHHHHHHHDVGPSRLASAASSGKAMPHSASDGNIVGRRNRSTSYGSTSDTSYYDTSSTATLSRTASVGSWRNNNSNSDPSMASSMSRGGGAGGGRNLPPVHYATAAHDAGDYSNASPGSHRQQQQRFAVMMSPGAAGAAAAAAGVRIRRSPRGGPGGNRRGENDEGFTMMTSALLNMLDAPEELVGYDHDGQEEDDDFDGEDPHLYYEAAYPQSAHLSQPDPHAIPRDSFDPEFFERLSISRNASYGVPERTGHDGSSSWSPGVGHNDDTMQRVIHQHAAAATTTPTHGPNSHGGNGGGGDYGLFLS